MRTEQIHYLKVINQYSSINTAAKMLNISPQALSLSMNSLEEELGFVILNRTRFGSFLTSQGTELLTHGQKFLDAVENMKQNRSIKHPALTHAT
ncbi:MAG: LysR family transcriptional regulator, partial [Peptococcaceae bacterium]|nr:LysR family transcriptional regulator [Peptococcaceae bacterium]